MVGPVPAGTPGPALTPRAHALTPRAGKAPKGKKGLAREAGARGFKNASAAALAPPQTAVRRSARGGPARAPARLRQQQGTGRATPPPTARRGRAEGPKRPAIIWGPFWPRAPTGGAPNQPEGPQARQAKEGGPSPRGGPPDAAGTDKMQGRPRPKGIKAGPCILPLHFGRGCGMALPPPRPADRPRDDRQRRPPKRNKGACAGWRPAAPGASVPGVSGV